MADCACLLCGECQARESAKREGTNKQSPEKLGARHKPVRRFAGQVADAVVVYILGDVDAHTRQLDVYSGLNGYRIRSIPSSRWRNPVLVGAGAGYVVIVDRFSDYDLLRVTDAYAGAGAGAFDDFGSPSSSLDWENVADIVQIPTPRGQFVTGLKVFPTGDLIVGLTAGASKIDPITGETIEPAGQYMKIPLGLENAALLRAPYGGIVTLSDPFPGGIGTIHGAPAPYDQIAGKRIFEMVGLADSPGGGTVVFLADYLQEKVLGLVGLPASEIGEPIAVAQAVEIATVLYGSAGQGTKLVRLFLSEKNTLLSGTDSDKIPPSPEEYPVSHTFTEKDVPGGADPSRVVQAIELIRTRNTGSDVSSLTPEEYAAIHKATTLTAPITPTDSISASEGRTQARGSVPGDAYNIAGIKIPVSIIDIPEGSGLVFIESTYNTVTELYNKNDASSILFRCLHGSHYDWLSEGGYTYGCDTSVLTNGMKGISLATDVGAIPGTLKPLPDVKAALIDASDGRIIYREPKPLGGWKIYGGAYATLTSDSSPVTQTSCGDTVAHTATTLDGISRPAIGVSDLSVFTQNTTDYDLPWQYFMRQASAPNRIMLRPTLSYWSIWENGAGPGPGLGGDIAPAYRNLVTPVQIQKTQRLFYPHRFPLPAPIFEANSQGGFFHLGLPIEKTVDAQGNARYDVPQRIQKNVIFGPIDPSSAQKIDAVTGGEIEVVAPAGTGLEPWTTIPLSTLRRGCVIDPGIRSWVGIEILLKRDVSEFITDGASVWETPEVDAGFLGAKINKALVTDILHTSGAACEPPIGSVCNQEAGYVYDAGDQASGASGQWEVEVYLNGESAGVSSRQITDINDLTEAPADIAYLLQNTLNATLGESPEQGIYHTGLVYASANLVESVTVKVRLINLASNVYRVGYRTKEYWQCGPSNVGSFYETGGKAGYRPTTINRPGPDAPLAPYFGADPGFNWGNDCEALCFGNLPCTEFLGFGYQLCRYDHVARLVRNVVWEGQATYSIPESNNPYHAKNLAVGNYIDAFFHFDLNAIIPSYKINLRAGAGRGILDNGVCN